MIALDLLKLFWKPLAGIALAVALYFTLQAHDASIEQRGYAKGHVAGVKQGTADGYIFGHVAAITEREAADKERLATDTAAALERERALQEAIANESFKRQEEKAHYEKTIDHLRADARSGNSGMRLPAGSCEPGVRLHADATSAGVGAAGGSGDHAAGIDLLPQVAEHVLDAAADLRQGVRDRNALIVLYNQCRAAANSPP